MKTLFVKINDATKAAIHNKTWRCIRHKDGTFGLCDIDMPVGKNATGRVGGAKKATQAQLVSKAEWAASIAERRKKKPADPGNGNDGKDQIGQIGKNK